MRSCNLLLTLLFLSISSVVFSQNAILDGYVYESDNRGYLNMATVLIIEKGTDNLIDKVMTNKDGFFSTQVPLNKDFILTATKEVFETKEVEVSTRGIAAGKKVYAKIEMQREPGYIFEVTMADKRDDATKQVNAIQGALVEIFNNTTQKPALVLKDHPAPTFSFTFEKGNHYTIMIRKDKYFTKRMEAYVDIDGCILCFDGLDEVTPGKPGASDNLTEGNQMGTIMANVELTPIVLNESIKIKNIYYDLNKSNIRPDAAEELDKLIITLKDNPNLIVELGSHTDSQGKDSYNLELSQRRAQEAVSYITNVGHIPNHRISGRGYGETQIINKCANGIACEDYEHQENRRTELKIVGITNNNVYDGKSLEDIIRVESFDKILQDIQDEGVVQIKEGEQLPDEIRQQIEGTGKADVTTSAPVVTTTRPTTSTTPVMESPVRSTTVVTTNPVPQEEVYIDPGTTTTYSTPPTEEVQVYSNPSNSISLENLESGTPTRTTTETYSVETTTPMSSGGMASVGNETPYMEQGEVLGSTSSSSGYEISANTFVRPPKPLDWEYAGYKIEIQSSPSQLPLSHVIFSRHGNIAMEQKKNGHFAYLIGDFNNKNSASNFLRDIMIGQYPAAKVVKYMDGRRVSE